MGTLTVLLRYRAICHRIMRLLLWYGPRRRWEGNIKMNLYGVERGGVDWKDVAQDRDRWRALVNVVMNLQVP